MFSSEVDWWIFWPYTRNTTLDPNGYLFMTCYWQIFSLLVSLLSLHFSSHEEQICLWRKIVSTYEIIYSKQNTRVKLATDGQSPSASRNINKFQPLSYIFLWIFWNFIGPFWFDTTSKKYSRGNIMQHSSIFHDIKIILFHTCLIHIYIFFI